MSAPLRVVHVGFQRDALDREPRQLIAAWPTLFAVAGAVARAGVETTIVQAAMRDEQLVHDGVTAYFVGVADGGWGRVGRLRRPRSLLDVVASIAPDVVHVHGFQHPVALRHLTAALPRTPVLVQDHASRAPAGWRRQVWRWALAPAAGVAFAAKEQAAPFLAARVVGAHTRVFEIFESSSTFTPGDQSEARRATGLFGDPCLLWSGALDENKDPFTALDAVAYAAERLPAVRLWCCFRTAPLGGKVEQRITSDPALRNRVRLIGARRHEEMEAYFRAADLFIHTSRREGCSYAVIESLACGTAAIVSDIPSSRRLVGNAGAIVSVGDGLALGKAICEWAVRDRRALRTQARDRFERALSFDILGHELRRVYESIRRAA